MKTISSTDLLLIPELSHLRMIDVIDPKNDALIAPFLEKLGFDLEYPIEYMARQHRNLQGQVVIAYMIAGEIQCNKSFLSSAFATVEDRIIAAGYRDLGLAKDMSASLSTNNDYDSGVPEAFPPDLANPNEQDILEKINLLEDLLTQVRGSQYKLNGGLKTMEDYHNPEKEPAKKSRKRVSAAKVANKS